MSARKNSEYCGGIWAWLVLVFLVPGCASGIHSNSGIVYHIETRHDPPMRLFVANVDLKNPCVHVRVIPGGPDPDGPGKWQTILLEPTKIAEKERLDLVVNGDFFSPRRLPGMANSNLTAGMWAMVAGPAVTDGKAWATATNKRPCLVIHKNKKADIEAMGHAPQDAWELVAGNITLVKNGVVAPRPSQVKNPRTAVGLDVKGTNLVILVVDGRQPGLSVGMSDAEMGAEMLRLGCWNAINLDGGGSAIMAVRDPVSQRMRTINIPSDKRERPVANVLGVSVDSMPKP